MGHLKGIKGLPPPVDIYILVLGLVASWKLHYIEIMGMGYDIDGLGRQYRGLWECRGCIILKDEAGRNVKDPRRPSDGIAGICCMIIQTGCLSGQLPLLPFLSWFAQ